MTNVAVTAYGKISGKQKNDLFYFEGIPYGADPSGENRFLPPKPPESWEGVRECTSFGAKGIQSGNAAEAKDLPDEKSPLYTIVKQLTGLDEEVLGSEEISEDCLYLNVLTPALDEKKRPVLFYIHGGGFTGGSGRQGMGGEKLVKEENVVIVSANERLGAFGYLYLGHLDEKYRDSGNVGLLDLVAALHWVKDNIVSFGGDPENVTIMGESGGGMKVCALLAMKEAAGLFQKAVSISGVLPAGAYTREEAARVTDRILKALQIAPSEYRKILSVSAEEILKVCQDVVLAEENPLGFLPVGDGIHLPENTEGKFITYEWSGNVPVIAGSSEDECGLGFFDVQMTEQEAVEKLTEGKSIFSSADKKLLPQDARRLYDTCKEECRGEAASWKIYLKALSQLSALGQGAHRMIAARSQSASAPCWLYNMAFENEFGLGDMYRCAWHTADLMLFFRRTTDERNEKLSKVLGKMLGAFMKNGDPSLPEYAWEAYDSAKDQLMDFNEDIRFVHDPLRKTRKLCLEFNPKLLV